MRQPDLSLYDKYDYDYSTYWEKRQYEHDAEVNVLNKILKKRTGNWIIDIGGSYGRHVPEYRTKFHNAVIVDYSMKALKQARDILKNKGITNVETVAANAYHLPFRRNSVDTALMIRVIHHLEEPSDVLSEIEAILAPDSLFVLEYPNKIHIKSLVKNLLRLRLSYPFDISPIEVPSQGNNEGSGSDDAGIMYNYHPRHIKKLLVSREFEPSRSYSLSFLRIPVLKRIVPYSIMIRAEKILQAVLRPIPLTPSVIIEAKTKQPPEEGIDSLHARSLSEILACPKCKGDLTKSSGNLHCVDCALTFKKQGGIWDLRYPLIS